MTVWNEVMLYFSLVPKDIRKILFVLRDISAKRNITLAEYYIKTYRHLIPDGVEILEYDTTTNTVYPVYNKKIYTKKRTVFYKTMRFSYMCFSIR